jgi:hypothetical protein
MGDNFKWTDDDVLLIFLQHAYNLKVHLQIEGESIGAKFKILAEKLSEEFDREFTIQNLMQKLSRLRTAFIDKYAIDREGTNLSALEEEKKPYEYFIELIIQQCEAEDYKKQSKAGASGKLKKALAREESSSLSNQSTGNVTSK